VDEDQRTRRASVMSLVRDLVAVFGANEDALLGLFGAFAYDLVFQIEDLVQKRAGASRTSATIVLLTCRIACSPMTAPPRAGVVLSYDFAWKGRSTEGLPRETAESVYAKTPRQGIFRSRARRISGDGRGPRARPSRAAICSRRCRGQLFAEPCERSPAEVFPAPVPDQSVALWPR